MNNNKGCINWLEQEFLKLESTVGVLGVFYELLEKAKAMHKKEELELINFASKIFELGKSEFSYALLTNEEILELYNETFGGNNEQQ